MMASLLSLQRNYNTIQYNAKKYMSAYFIIYIYMSELSYVYVYLHIYVCVSVYINICRSTNTHSWIFFNIKKYKHMLAC